MAPTLVVQWRINIIKFRITLVLNPTIKNLRFFFLKMTFFFFFSFFFFFEGEGGVAGWEVKKYFFNIFFLWGYSRGLGDGKCLRFFKNQKKKKI